MANTTKLNICGSKIKSFLKHFNAYDTIMSNLVIIFTRHRTYTIDYLNQNLCLNLRIPLL